MDSAFLTVEAAHAACELTRLKALALQERGFTLGRGTYYGAIYAPMPYYDTEGIPAIRDLVLADFQIGDDLTKDDTTYDTICHGKAKVSMLTGLTSRQAVFDAPWAFEHDDFRYPGSGIMHTLVASGSGYPDEVDELLSFDLLYNAQMITRMMMSRGPTNAKGNHRVVPTPLATLLAS